MIYKLSDIISPAFSEPHRALKTGTHNQLILKGGRGSGKSSYASAEGVLLIIRNPQIHGVVMRKVGNTLRTTAYAQYVWAVSALGLYHKFKFTVSPMEITYKPTGQKIMFFGADDPGKIKSLKVQFGYIGYLHLEELDQFSGEDEMRNIEQSVLRGGPISFEIGSFNPPQSIDNWVNQYCLVDKPGQLIHHSTYLTTPPEWLGGRFINDAEFLNETSPKKYEHVYLGVATGSGGQVFDNLDIREITPDERGTFDRMYNGGDFGFANDPDAFLRMYYQKQTRTLFILNEIYGSRMNADVLSDKVKAMIGRDIVTCDSEDPRMINELKRRGIQALAAKKGPGSVEHGIRWLQDLGCIVIDKRACPNAAREFKGYEYKKDRQGNFLSAYADANNHTIDAVRYGIEEISTAKQGQIGKL